MMKVFLIVSFIISSFGMLSQFLEAILAIVAMKFLLDKYEERKVNIKFTFMEYLNFFVAQFMLAVAFVLLLIVLITATFYPVYSITVSDKDAFWNDANTMMKEVRRRDSNSLTETYPTFKTNDVYKDIDLIKYIDIKGNETATLSFLALFLIGLCALLYLVFRVSVTQWLIVDKKFGPINAIKHSWHITRNNVTQMSLLAIFATLIMIIGILVLGFGILFAIPLVYMITLDSYKQMIGESK